MVLVLPLPSLLWPDLKLLKQALDNVQQNVPRHSLELPLVLLDEPGYGEDDLIGHHLVWTGHGLEHKAQGAGDG